MISWHGILFSKLEHFWKNLRIFTYNNRTLVEVFFIFAYVIEQAVLVILTYQIKDISLLALIISLFAIIVLTTFALHKLVMESRIKLLEENLSGVVVEKTNIESKGRYIVGRYEALADAYEQLISKDLNTSRTKEYKKRLR